MDPYPKYGANEQARSAPENYPKVPSASLFRLLSPDFRLHANDAPSAAGPRPQIPAAGGTIPLRFALCTLYPVPMTPISSRIYPFLYSPAFSRML